MTTWSRPSMPPVSRLQPVTHSPSGTSARCAVVNNSGRHPPLTTAVCPPRTWRDGSASTKVWSTTGSNTVMWTVTAMCTAAGEWPFPPTLKQRVDNACSRPRGSRCESHHLLQEAQYEGILGTAAYMSPEQAKGRLADKRSDVWAFGAVLYEMLTGARAFGGEDVSDTLANVLKSPPDWSALPPNLPPAI